MKYSLSILFITIAICPSSYSNSSENTRNELKEKVRFWEGYGHVCPRYKYPSKQDLGDPKNPDKCDDGDAVIFNGMLCAAGYQQSCRAVSNSQVLGYSHPGDSENGKWYRSPWRKDDPSKRTSKLEFSRDQVVGLYFYFIAQGRRSKSEAVKKMTSWIDWVQKNDYKVCEKGGTTDCKMTPLNWSFMGRLYEHYGVPLKAVMKNGENYKIENTWATKQVIKNSSGYQTHNYVATALAMDLIGNAGGKGEWMKILSAKSEMKGNPFFGFVHRKVCGNECGGVPNYKDIAKKVIDLCPNKDSRGPKRQWAWERANSEKAWEKSMGWDCVFLGKMLLKERW